MFPKTPTYSIAANLIGQHVQAIEPGAFAPLFESRDENGRMLSLAEDCISGKYLILVFLDNPDESLAVDVLKSFSRRRAEFVQNEATVIAVNSCSDAAVNTSLSKQADFCWPILCDAGGSLFASYGIHKSANNNYVRIVVLTPLRQIRTWFDNPTNIDETVEVIMNQILPVQIAENEMWSVTHAPVLIIPNVLSPEECGHLITSFETGGPFHVSLPGPNAINADFKMPVYEHNRQDRVDHIVKDQNILALLNQRISTRINPAIKKAFAFDVRRREEFHIARYVGKRGGNKMGHRDNTSPSTAYRRFALSMNLNDDYEGGEVVFKEYGPHGYRGKPGTALIFSSSLLHEVLETTKGTRYNLISHLFDDSSAPGPARR